MNLRLFLFGVILVLLASCAVSPAAEQTPTQSVLPNHTPSLSVMPTQTLPQSVLPTQTPPLPVLPTQTLTNVIPEEIRPTARPDLEASNPAEFNLAAGKLQLVEFFAYW